MSKTTTTTKARAARKSATELPTVSLYRRTNARLIELAKQHGVTPCGFASHALDHIFDQIDAGTLIILPNRPDED